MRLGKRTGIDFPGSCRPCEEFLVLFCSPRSHRHDQGKEQPRRIEAGYGRPVRKLLLQPNLDRGNGSQNG